MQSIDEAANLNNSQLANIINEAFLSSMSDFSPLPNDFSHSTNLDSNEAVFSATSLLKENSELLSDPVKEILNSIQRLLPPTIMEKRGRRPAPKAETREKNK